MPVHTIDGAYTVGGGHLGSTVLTIDGPSCRCGQMQGAQLGDIICTAGDCKVGESAVDQMLQVFYSLRTRNMHKPFEPIVEAIYASFEKTKGWNWPFSSNCCKAKEIGRQAQGVTAQMLAAHQASLPGPTGRGPVPTPTPNLPDTLDPTPPTAPSIGLLSVVKVLGIIGAAALTVWMGVHIYKAATSGPATAPAMMMGRPRRYRRAWR